MFGNLLNKIMIEKINKLEDSNKYRSHKIYNHLVDMGSVLVPGDSIGPWVEAILESKYNFFIFNGRLFECLDKEVRMTNLTVDRKQLSGWGANEQNIDILYREILKRIRIKKLNRINNE